MFQIIIPGQRHQQHFPFSPVAGKKPQIAELVCDKRHRSSETGIDVIVRLIRYGLLAVFPIEKPLRSLRGQIVCRVVILKKLLGNDIPSSKDRILPRGVFIPYAVLRACPTDSVIQVWLHPHGIFIVRRKAKMFGGRRAGLEGNRSPVIVSITLFGDHIDESGTYLAVFRIKAAPFYRDFFDGAKAYAGDRLVIPWVAKRNSVQQVKRLISSSTTNDQAILDTSL